MSEQQRTTHLSDERLAELAQHELEHPAQTPRAMDTPDASAEDAARSSETSHLDEESRSHLDHCEECREALASTVRVLQAMGSPSSLAEPPPELWDRISADLGLSDEPAPDQDEPADQAAPVVDLAGHRAARSRRRRWLVPAAAAVAGIAVGAASMALSTGLLGDPEAPPSPTPAPVAVGDAALDPVADAEFSGSAEMVEHADGTLELTVEVPHTADPADGYFEVWLRDEDATRLISLGTITATSTRLTVPEGVDLEQYPIVDVSHEHFDGDPSHSGITLAAGPMRTASG